MGSLSGITVIEMAGLGPAPFAAMMLADQGARIIRVERPGATPALNNVLCRNRSSIVVDLQTAAGKNIALDLIGRADALIEGFRPGVMERLSLGPDICLQRNPKLVYGRMTGWGQSGPLARTAGHDLNYIALTGVAHAVGHAGQAPVHPLNLVGDYGGGGMLLSFGVMCALWEAAHSGRGQVIDAAMIDGVSALMAEYYSFMANGEFSEQRGTHLLDGGAPFYSMYQTRDGQYISIGALEPKFYAQLLEKLGITDDGLATQYQRGAWPAMKARLRELFATRTRAEWCELLEGSDTCFAPVLFLADVADHPHHAARQTIIDVNGVRQAAPAPRFSRTPASRPRPPRMPGQDTQSVLESLGYSAQQITDLLRSGAIECAREDE